MFHWLNRQIFERGDDVVTIINGIMNRWFKATLPRT